MPRLELKPSQVYGLKELKAKIDAGEKRIVLVTPTGGGKTRMAEEIFREVLGRNGTACFYVHRRLLGYQSVRRFQEAGLPCGLRMSGEQPEFEQPVQVATLQTENSRAIQQSLRQLHESDVVIFDELHAVRGAMAQEIANRHLKQGAVFIGLTATPLDIWGMVDSMVVAAKNSDLRKEGLHVICHHYAPSDPEMCGLTRNKYGDYSTNDIVSRMPRSTMFGSIIDNYRRLNPEQKPAILFAPSVRESKGSVDDLEKAGISAASIDGENVYWNGREYKSDQPARDEVLEASKAGDLKVICNRFVLREGVDSPWIYHCISATAWGGLTSYLQAGGRLLRSHPSLDHVIFQDHGGSVWMHGTLNEDRDWEIGECSKKKTDDRIEDMRNERVKEPIRCPVCFGFREDGDTCPYCGHQHKKNSRSVYQSTGELKRIDGRVFKKKRTTHSVQKIWDSMAYASKNSRSPRANTFKQLYGRFHRENPELRIKVRNGKTCVVSQDGTVHNLGRIPSPGSPYWSMQVRSVDFKKLQSVIYE